MSETIQAAPAPDESVGHARKSSFYLAMRILPKQKRQAMYEVYAFCRLVDDIADDGGSRDARHAGLDGWRRDIDALYRGELPRESLRELAKAIRGFGLRAEDFHAVIDGMDMDVVEDIRAPDWTKLELYCDRVASAVGRLSVRIFGTPPTERDRLAHHLGKALQLTNILRDIDEDAEIGRLYLPKEALESAGITTNEPSRAAADPRLPTACVPVVARAREHFAAAREIMRRCPRTTVRAARVMDEAYGEIFERTVARGFESPRQRLKVSKGRFLLSLLRHGLF